MWSLVAALLTGTAQVVRLPVATAETLQVTLAGAGRSVAFVPGLFGSAFAYRRIVPPLVAAGYRTIVVEPLGIGGSARPARADYSLTAQADRIAAVLDSLRVGGVIVVAHSVGASMALRLALRRPELVAGVVSLDGGPAEAAATPSFRRAMRFAPLLKLFGGRRRIERAVRDNLIAASGDAVWVTEAAVRGYTAAATANLDATLDAFRGMAAAREPQRLDANLARIRCPVRVLVGGAPHQSGIGAADLALLAELLPDFAVDSVAGAGHFIHEERPEAVVDAVRSLDAADALVLQSGVGR